MEWIFIRAESAEIEENFPLSSGSYYKVLLACKANIIQSMVVGKIG